DGRIEEDRHEDDVDDFRQGDGRERINDGVIRHSRVRSFFCFRPGVKWLRQSFHSGCPTIKVPRLTGKENNWLIFIAAGSGCRWGKFAYTKTGYEGSRRTGRSMENRLAGNNEILLLDRKSTRLNSSHQIIS